MNYIKHLASFFNKVATDERLNPTHISMYVSLFQFWNINRFINPISISRNELMKVSKISSKATYHKCMKELNDWQYLKYKPSYNPYKGSLVYLFNFSTGEIEKNEPPNLFNSQPSSEQALVVQHTKIGTSIEQAQEPYININKHNKQNSTNLDKQAKKSVVQNLNVLEKQKPISPSPVNKGQGEAEKEKLRQKKKNVIANDVFARLEAICSFEQVQEYFASQKFPAIEAQKFYNYFQSNGWLVGGRTKMKDWKAAANNWIINAKRFSNSPPLEGLGVVKSKAKNLHTNQNKNYNEPL
jgi:hypothetical protein